MAAEKDIFGYEHLLAQLPIQPRPHAARTLHFTVNGVALFLRRNQLQDIVINTNLMYDTPFVSVQGTSRDEVIVRWHAEGRPRMVVALLSEEHLASDEVVSVLHKILEAKVSKTASVLDLLKSGELYPESGHAC